MKFPRITSEDFFNATMVIATVLKDKDSIKHSNYNNEFRKEILEAVEQIEKFIQTKPVGVSEKENLIELPENYSTEDFIRLALTGYQSILNDKDATAASKQQAIKFLRETTKELDDLTKMKAQNEKFSALEELIKQFLTRLLDEKIEQNPRGLANEFLNRLKELVEND